MKQTPSDMALLPRVVRYGGYAWWLLTKRGTLFCTTLLFLWLWRTHPVYTPDEAIRLEKERLRTA